MEQLRAFHKKMKTEIALIEEELADHTLKEIEMAEKCAKLSVLREMLEEYESSFAEELTLVHVKMGGKRVIYIYNDKDYRTIEQLDFTIRTYVVLKRAKYTTAQQLRDTNLEKIPNISQKSIEEIKRKLNL